MVGGKMFGAAMFCHSTILPDITVVVVVVVYISIFPSFLYVWHYCDQGEGWVRDDLEEQT